MSLELTASRALFIQDAIVAGECVLDDPFKPYIHPMRTPAGHVVTSAMPVDHRHHKGLMFALRCADLNFWEENPGSPDCGVQKILAAHTENDALLLELLWCDEAGGFQTYHEHRRVSCAPGPRGGFHWTWHSHRKALRDHCLIQSEWSCQLPDGRKINYHGLGVRLPWAWSWPGSNLCGVKIDGTPVEPEKACGTHGPSVTWWGKIDGHWIPPIASVTMRQDHSFDWFVLKGPFAYLSAGPSNRGEIDVTSGDIFEETYHIHIQDLA